MVRALHHRGPDGHGALVEGPIGLGHARLSIIDLAGGAQPLGNEDGQIQVVFNGEIFNYLELRADLLARGHIFRTASDTEVLVHLYEEHGDDFFMKRTYTGTAIRAVAQDRQIMSLMGVDTRRIYLITSALGGALAGLAACLLVLQYDVHPFVGLSFGPITFLICVLGGLGNFVGGFIAAFVFAQIISLGGLFSDLEWGYVLAFAFFIVMMFIRPAGLFARRS